MRRIESFNLELTTRCPLHCPQCYCTLEGGKDLPLENGEKVIEEAAELGAEHVELSGGETLCYPYLLELIKHARLYGIKPNISISGWHFDQNCLASLIEAGINGIFVSVNAPTPEQNALTRDGFDLALHALKVVSESGFDEFYINWVMHRDTADTLPEMIRLVNPYHPKGIVILMPKPDAAHTLNSYPTCEQMERTVQLVKNKNTNVFVENCFSPLLALLGRNALWGNRNRGIYKGCGAGLTSFSVSVDGLYSPCRHLDYYESYPSLKEYWENSSVLNQIRALDNTEEEPCKGCEFCDNCRNCLAIDTKLYGELRLGYTDCPLPRKYTR